MRAVLYSWVFAFVLVFGNTNPAFSQEGDFHNMLSRAEALFFTDVGGSISLASEVSIIADSLNDEKLKAAALKTMGLAAYFSGAYNDAVVYLEESLALFAQSNDSAGMSACYNGLAVVHRDLGVFDMAARFFTRALEIDYQLNDLLGMAVVYNNLGILYHMQERPVPALACYVRSLRIEMQLNNMSGIADSYLNIAAILEEGLLYQAAYTYLEKATSIYEFEADSNRLGYVYNNMGKLLMGLQKYHRAIDAYNKSLSVKEQTADYSGRITTLLNLGDAYIVLGDTASAKSKFEEAVMLDMQLSGNNKLYSAEFEPNSLTLDDYLFYFISHNQDFGDFYEMATRLFYRGYICFVLSEFEKAILFFLNSLELSEYQEDTHLRRQNYYYLFHSHKNIGNYQHAIRFAENHMAVSDELQQVFFRDYFELMQQASGLYLFFDSGQSKTIEMSENKKQTVWLYVSIILAIIVAIQFKVRRR